MMILWSKAFTRVFIESEHLNIHNLVVYMIRLSFKYFRSQDLAVCCSEGLRRRELWRSPCASKIG